MKYMAVVHKDKDSSFGVSFPDLPGCFGAGESRDEALESAKISLREYAKSMDEMNQGLPEPRSLDAIYADPALSEIIEGCEFFIEVPLIAVGIRRRVNISIDDRVLEAIDDACKVAGVNRSAFLTEVACNWLTKNAGAVSTSEKGLLTPKPSATEDIPARKRA